MQHIELYSDGACSGNPGPGGWGCILKFNNTERHLSGYEAETTNNRMEMSAIINGLKHLKRPCHICITTDSQYVKNAFTQGWLSTWQKNQWRTSNKDPVKNQDLWQLLLAFCEKHTITWEWVKGHSGHYYNELCDSLARNAIINKIGVDEKKATK